MSKNVFTVEVHIDNANVEKAYLDLIRAMRPYNGVAWISTGVTVNGTPMSERAYQDMVERVRDEYHG